MSWQITGRARVNPAAPKAFAICDRCQFLYNRDDLTWQYEWQFQKVHNLRLLVCPTCHDKLQEQLKRVVLPVDPMPIANPRPGEFGAMVLSSNPNPFATIVPSYITTEGTVDALGQYGGTRSILVTELSCIPIVTEVTNTMILTSSGVTQGPDAITSGLNALVGGNST